MAWWDLCRLPNEVLQFLKKSLEILKMNSVIVKNKIWRFTENLKTIKQIL